MDDTNNNNNNKVKLMCSYGGKIHPRSYYQSHHNHKQQLSYFYSGGHNKLLTVNRTINFSNLFSKLRLLSDSNNANFQMLIKYKLPGRGSKAQQRDDDLEPLISVFDDDDVIHMMFEYDILRRVSGISPARLRLFLFFPARPVALLNPDFLFGFDKEYSFNSSTVGPTTEEICEDPDVVVPEEDVIIDPKCDPDPEVFFMRDSYVYRQPGNAGGCCQAGLYYYYNRCYTDCGGK